MIPESERSPQLRYYYSHKEERRSKPEWRAARRAYMRRYNTQNKAKLLIQKADARRRRGGDKPADPVKKSAYNKAYRAVNAESLAAGRLTKRRARERWFHAMKSRVHCVDCNASDPAIIDFHHTNPATKVMGISEMVRREGRISDLLTEIAQCIPLCANCHRKRHYPYYKYS